MNKHVWLIPVLFIFQWPVSSQTLFSETFNDVGPVGTSAEGVTWICNPICNPTGTFASTGLRLVCNNPKQPATWETGVIDVSGAQEVVLSVYFEVEGDLEGDCNLGASCECAPATIQSSPECGTISSFDFIDFGYRLDGGAVQVFPDQLGCIGAPVICSPACGSGPYGSCDVSGGGVHTYYGDCLSGNPNDLDMNGGTQNANFFFSSTLYVSSADDLQLVFTMMNGASTEFFRLAEVTITASVLPVELTTFHATPEQGAILLQWRTAMEKDHWKFTVERASEGKVFQPIGTVPGKGNLNVKTDYLFHDRHPVPGTNYYRLAQHSFGGIVTYSPVISAIYEGASRTVLFPNPVVSDLQVTFPQVVRGPVRFSLFDLKGRQIKTMEKEATENSFTLSLEGIPSGPYLLRIRTRSKAEVYRVMVNGEW